jgi:hypothetical protein
MSRDLSPAGMLLVIVGGCGIGRMNKENGGDGRGVDKMI